MLIIWLFSLAPSFTQSGEIFANLMSMASLQTIKEFFTEYVLIGVGRLQILARYGLLFVALFGVTIVDYLKYKEINVAERFNRQAFWFRWTILFAMIITIISFGVYGPGYNPVDFIYGGF